MQGLAQHLTDSLKSKVQSPRSKVCLPRRKLSSLAAAGRLRCLEEFLQLRITRVSGGESFLIMPVGQLRGRRLLRDINHREVIMRIGAGRIDLNGLAQGRLGWPAQPLLAEREAEEVLDLGIQGIERRRAAEGVDGLIVFSLAELQAAQDEEAIRVIRRESDSLLDVNLRGLEMVEVELNGGEVSQGGDIGLVLLEHLQVFLLGFVELLVRVVTVRLRHQ